MERLTKRKDYAYLANCNANACRPDCDDCEVQHAAIERLAAYEDTGLAPEEIKALAAIGGGFSMNTDRCAHKIFSALPPRRASGAICPHCGTQLAVAYHEERLYSVECCNCKTITLVKARNPYEAAEKVGIVARPAEDYHEDYGDVLWWHFPIEEPPEVGTPDTYDRYGRPVITEYHTHWTPIPIPNEPKEEGQA